MMANNRLLMTEEMMLLGGGLGWGMGMGMGMGGLGFGVGLMDGLILGSLW